MSLVSEPKNGIVISHYESGAKQQKTNYFNNQKHGLEFWFRNNDELLYLEKWNYGESAWEIGFEKYEQFSLDANIELLFYPTPEFS